MADELESEDDVKAISALITALKPLNAETRVHVLEFVIKRLGISLSDRSASPALVQVSAPIVPKTATIPRHPDDVHDIRTFAAQKQPRTVNEKVAVIGYYLAHLAPENERRDYLVSDDIKTYFIQADFELPTAPPSMALTHAKNAGYLNALERGRYRLNAVGYNLVAHKLPTGDASEPRRGVARSAAKKKIKTRKKAGK